MPIRTESRPSRVRRRSARNALWIAAFAASGFAAAVLGVAMSATSGPRIGAAASLLAGGSVRALQVETAQSVGELTAMSDAVVRGRIVDAVPGRVFGEPGGNALHYAAAALHVDEVVAGALPAGQGTELTLEIPLFDGPSTIEGLQASLPSGEGLFFLRNKGTSAARAGLSSEIQAAEASYYRLVVFGAVAFDAAGRATVAGGESEAVDELAGLSFDEAIQRVRDGGR